MAKVLDSFKIGTKPDQKDSSQPPSMSEGIWFVLDTTYDSVMPRPGQTATVIRPDGSVTTSEVTESQIRHSVLALRLKDVGADDVPRLSEIEW